MGQLTNETVTLCASAPLRETISRSTDALGRPSGFALDDDYAVSYAYDMYGRFHSVASAASATSAVTFTYSYLPDTDLISGMTASSGLLWTRAYESARSLITSVENRYGETVISRYDYVNDELGRRTAISRSGAAFGDLPIRDAYEYNPRSEVTSARRTPVGSQTELRGFSYDYDYDAIGNRITSTEYDHAGGALESEYTANALNQYGQRTVPGYAGVRGEADTNATVTVNADPAWRWGGYFYGGDDADNSADAVMKELEITATYSNLFTSVTGRVFVAETPEAFTYDDDGNLTQDGRFTYDWDAENRLVGVTTRDDLPTGVPRVKVDYLYDHQSRRIASATAVWTNDAWQAVESGAFLYDGWNVVTELTHSQNHTVTNSYLWGLDLSGSLQGAGGISGLLAASLDGTAALYCYDANGNVGQLVSSDGNMLAHYEYSPFGETVVSTGPLAKANPFRFSTKHWDDLTGLGYWGYRWYHPDMGRWLSRDPIGEIQPLTQRLMRLNRRHSLQLYPYVDNRGVCLIDHLGLMWSPPSPPSNDEACAQAKPIVKKSNVQGTTICYKGKLIGCVWDKSLKKFTEFPKLLACVQAHEDLHVKQAAPYKPCDCRPKDIFPPPGNAKDECEAYSAEETCLKKAMLDDCDKGYDPATDYEVCDDCTPCERVYGFEITNVIKWKNYYCGKSGGK